MRNCLRQIRRNADITQDKLASSVGVSRQTIIGIERGYQEPSVTLALKIAVVFNKDPREIFFAENVNFVHRNTSA